MLMPRKDSYFMRVFYWDWDVEGLAPVLIKIPLALLSPSREMMRLLIALENFYNVDCYLVIEEIEEDYSSNTIGFYPCGVVTSETLIVTTILDDDTEAVCGMTSYNGEYEILSFDKGKDLVVLTADEHLADYLDLEYLEEVTDLHRQYLESIDCDDCDENVYFPNALYHH